LAQKGSAGYVGTEDRLPYSDEAGHGFVSDWQACNKRDLHTKDVVRWSLGGTVVRVRVDRKSTSISLLIVLGVRRNGQKVLLANRSMGGEAKHATASSSVRREALSGATSHDRC
jgi:hypothetical protein